MIPGGRDWAQDGLWSPALALPASPQVVKTPEHCSHREAGPGVTWPGGGAGVCPSPGGCGDGE